MFANNVSATIEPHAILKSVIAVYPVGVVIVDPLGNIILANGELERTASIAIGRRGSYWGNTPFQEVGALGHAAPDDTPGKAMGRQGGRFNPRVGPGPYGLRNRRTTQACGYHQ